MRFLFPFVFLICTIPCFSLETGYASWYGGKFHGRITANGEVYDMNKLTAAHKTLPFGTFVKVVNIDNGKSIVVKINDRGPFVEGRIIDLSRAAAEKIDMLKTGIARVFIEVVPGAEDKEFLYSIQIGSYSEQKNAIHLRDFLKEKGFTVTIEVSSNGFHRVIVTDIEYNSLQPLLKELADVGFIHVLVKRKEQPGQKSPG
ncbi:MAG: septal ring lytic transglycosylase RlpA family protein [Spirochaetales bacterium]|nr:septal ring lytic transglycosylase RlpA family protein [Spirochaetales bacterium]